MIIINKLPITMFRCLIATILIEMVVAIIIGIRNKKDILNIILVNIVTNPLVSSISVYFYYKYGIIYRNISLILLEIFTVVFEGFIFSKNIDNKKIKGFVLSIILNTCSYFIGEVINNIIIQTQLLQFTPNFINIFTIIAN